MIRSVGNGQQIAAMGAAMMLRLFGLTGRMVLVIAITRILGLDATAHYGFVVAASALLLALTGFGLDYEMHRATVLATTAATVGRFRDRLLLRSVASAGGMAIAAVALGNFFPGSPLLTLSVPAILLGEAVVVDIQQVLVARGRPILANMVLFARAALWIPPVLAIGWIVPEERTLSLVLAGWAICLWCTITATVIATVRIVPLSDVPPIDWRWIRTAPRHAREAWLSDLAFAVSLYSDRFLVSALLGAEAAGALVFVWSFTNAIVPLVQSIVFDRLRPALVRFHDAGALAQWRGVLVQGRTHVAWASAILGVALVAVVQLMAPRVGVAPSGVTLGFVAIMALATAVRLQADFLRHALVSLGNDSAWARTDLAVLAASPVLGALAILAIGLPGAAVQMMATALLLCGSRWRILQRATPS